MPLIVGNDGQANGPWSNGSEHVVFSKLEFVDGVAVAETHFASEFGERGVLVIVEYPLFSEGEGRLLARQGTYIEKIIESRLWV